MRRVVMRSTVSADGILHLTVPVGPEEAHKEVQVTVEPVNRQQPMTQEEWHAFVLATAGSISDPTFERPPQGDYEERESLP
jgi:hypothetical protein